MALTRAQGAAWQLYMRRIEDTLREQLQQFEHGWPVLTLMMKPPSPEQVKAIDAALEAATLEAKQQIASAALGPLVDAIDAIDNSHTKKASRAVRELYKELDSVYERLLVLKKKVEAMSPAETEQA